jgi:hypothetical protein
LFSGGYLCCLVSIAGKPPDPESPGYLQSEMANLKRKPLEIQQLSKVLLCQECEDKFIIKKQKEVWQGFKNAVD